MRDPPGNRTETLSPLSEAHARTHARTCIAFMNAAAVFVCCVVVFVVATANSKLPAHHVVFCRFVPFCAATVDAHASVLFAMATPSCVLDLVTMMNDLSGLYDE